MLYVCSLAMIPLSKCVSFQGQFLHTTKVNSTIMMEAEICLLFFSFLKLWQYFSVQGLYSNTFPRFNFACAVQHDGISAHW